MKKFTLLFIISISLFSCTSSPEEITSQNQFAYTSTSFIWTSTPTATKTPTITPLFTPTFTAGPIKDPRVLVTLGEVVPSPWSRGVPLFSPDGNIIALATTPRIRLWDAHTYQLIFELENPYSEKCIVYNVSFSDDGGYFAVSITGCWNEGDSVPPGHLLVWDLSDGSLIHEWDQEYAFMVDSKQGEFSIPVYAMTFLPNSTKLAYATGNSIAIRDVSDLDSDPENLSLGHDMYATEISVRDDSQYLFVLMEWYKMQDFPFNYRKEFRLQSWHLDPNYLNLTREYPEVVPSHGHMSLHKDNLLHYDYINGTLEVRNLTTNSVDQFPGLTSSRGEKYFNSDLSLMIDTCLTHCRDGTRFDLWNTDTWKILYSFLPDYIDIWLVGFDEIVFSPDNMILAIVYHEQVSLWNINAIVNPDFNP